MSVKKPLETIALILMTAVVALNLAYAQPAETNSVVSTSECLELRYNLRYKSRDAVTNGEVSLLQEYLYFKRFLHVQPNGRFGVNTLKAVKDFQRVNRISATGYVGPVTRARIKKVSCTENENTIPEYNPMPTPTPIAPIPSPDEIPLENPPGDETTPLQNQVPIQTPTPSPSASVSPSPSSSATPTPTPTASPSSSPSPSGSPSPSPQAIYITSFTLINADSDQPIAGYENLPNGVTVDLSTIGTRRINMRINVSSDTRSIKLTLPQVAAFNNRIESAQPFSLAGDDQGDYVAWTPTPGSYTLTAIPYNGVSGTGSAGISKTLNFTITESL